MDTEYMSLVKEINEMKRELQKLTGLVEVLFRKTIDDVPDKEYVPDASLDVHIESADFPSTRAYVALRGNANAHTYRDLTYLTKKNIRNVRNIGERTAQEIFAVLKEKGIDIPDEAKEEPPIYNIGEPVMARLDCVNKYGEKLTAGDIIRVVDRTQNGKNYRYHLAEYTCRNAFGKEWNLSPGEIMHL